MKTIVQRLGVIAIVALTLLQESTINGGWHWGFSLAYVGLILTWLVVSVRLWHFIARRNHQHRLIGGLGLIVLIALVVGVVLLELRLHQWFGVGYLTHKRFENHIFFWVILLPVFIARSRWHATRATTFTP